MPSTVHLPTFAAPPPEYQGIFVSFIEALKVRRHYIMLGQEQCMQYLYQFDINNNRTGRVHKQKAKKQKKQQ